MIHNVKQKYVAKPPKFECTMCRKPIIVKKLTLQEHLLTMQIAGKKFMCTQCCVNNQLVKTFNTTPNNQFFNCDKCSSSFRNKSEFDEHISESRQELKCYICQELINSECNFKIHTDSHISKEIKTEKIEINTESEILEHFEANTLIQLESSTTTTIAKDLEKIKCQHCSKTFDLEVHFKSHRTDVHPNTWWKCDFKECTKSYYGYHLLKLHKMMHSETKPYVCNICKKAFYRPDSLRSHERTHLKEQKCKCSMCPKSFPNGFRLRAHIANNHGGWKPFKCPVMNCETSWATNGELNVHLITHTTEKSFKCEYCTKFIAFKNMRQLRQHHRSVHLRNKKVSGNKHSDAVLYICRSSQCFFESGNLAAVAIHYNEQHQLPKVSLFQNCSSAPVVLTNKKPKLETNQLILKRYQCEICSKLFKGSTYSGHLKTHLNENSFPFKCPHCPKLFKYVKNLPRHIRDFHCKTKRSGARRYNKK